MSNCGIDLNFSVELNKNEYEIEATWEGSKTDGELYVESVNFDNHNGKYFEIPAHKIDSFAKRHEDKLLKGALYELDHKAINWIEDYERF